MLKLPIIVLFATTLISAQETRPDHRLKQTSKTFQEIMATPDKGIPHDLFDKAACIVIVPGVKKGAFGVGGKYGRGFASCRHGDGGWTSPAAVAIEGGSFGFQIGGSSTDLVLLVMNKPGMDRLLGDKFTLGGDAAVAAGPVGRESSADTDVLMKAEMLSWSRSKGLFAGVSLQGATLRPDGDENRKLYGRDISNREILETGVPTPAAGRQFVALLDRYSGAVSSTVAGSLANKGGRFTLGESELRFATGQSALPNNAAAMLTQVANTLKDHSDWKVRIEGFTDNVGSSSLNKKLSEARARSVAHWLIEHGVARNRVSTKGYGDGRPVADNSTENGRAKNRRVEVVRL